MAVTMVTITLDVLAVLESAQLWGPAKWKCTGTVNNNKFGDWNAELSMSPRSVVKLDASVWSYKIAVAEADLLKPIQVQLWVSDTDPAAKNPQLGSVQASFVYPFNSPQIVLTSPVIKNPAVGDRQYYSAQLKVEVSTDQPSTFDISGRVMVTRQKDGSNLFNTILGKSVVPRVEVCPVIPVPAPPTPLPPRPVFSREFAMGASTSQGMPQVFSADSPLNAMVNPSFIPNLSAYDPDLKTKAARLAITFYQPSNLDVQNLSWHIVDGPVAFVGGSTGPEVMVRGTAGSKDTDKWAHFEVRWNGNKPVLATFRAWVGQVKQVPYRINLISGKTPESIPVLTESDVTTHVAIAQVILWQAGIHLIPDPDATCYEGAVASKDNPGIFSVTVDDPTWTINVTVLAAAPIASRLNYRVGVVNITYVRSTAEHRAAATDRGGLTQFDQTDSDTPSASWVIPTGVLPDAKQGTVTLHSMPPTYRSTVPAVGDFDYITARQKVDKKFTADSLKAMNALVAPSNWSDDHTSVAWGVNIAHELGHVLGLRHRGSGDASAPPLSEDGVNCTDMWGHLRGHPWNENIMTYGYGHIYPPRATDMDVLQVPVVRKFVLAAVKS